LLDKRGRVKIADFGLAKIVGLTPTYLTLTGSHEVMGTLYYMAPEQVRRSHVVDHRADLYSLGVVFYEMLTGELPLGRFAPPSNKARVDERLDAVVLRALAREPEHRFQDAVGLKREVEGVAAAESTGQSAQSQRSHPSGPRFNGNWPNVRFLIHGTSWMGQARGEIYRDQDMLILEFEEFRLFQKSELKELRIPFTEIASITCKRRFGNVWLIIKGTRYRTLSGLPAGQAGRGRFLVHREDREAAKQLVQSIIDSHSQTRGGGLLEQEPESEKARMVVLAPAVGLLATGILAFAGSLIAGLVLTVALSDSSGFSAYSLLALLALPVMAAGLVLIIGAWNMMRLKSYSLAVTAAILALIPWWVTWIIGLPFGILALIVLRRRHVMAAFLDGSASEAPPRFQVKAPRAGKVVSFFRSVRGYFLPTSAGRNSLAEPLSGKIEENQDGLLKQDKSLPAQPTLNYSGKALAPKSGGQDVKGG